MNPKLIKKEFGCRFCKGVTANKCWFCGFKKPKKQDMDDEEWNQYDNWCIFVKWMKSLHTKMKIENQVTTECPELDSKVRYWFGRWTDKKLFRFVDQKGVPESFDQFSSLIKASIVDARVVEIKRESNESFLIILQNNNWDLLNEIAIELATELEIEVEFIGD